MTLGKNITQSIGHLTESLAAISGWPGQFHDEDDK